MYFDFFQKQTYFPWEARKVTPSQSGKILFTVQLKLTVSHLRHISLSS